ACLRRRDGAVRPHRHRPPPAGTAGRGGRLAWPGGSSPSREVGGGRGRIAAALFGRASPAEEAVVLPVPSVAENLQSDYARTGLSLGPHPLQLIRPRLRAARFADSRSLRGQPHQSPVRAAGLVTQRQRPQTASGVTFITIEDEHGAINVV